MPTVFPQKLLWSLPSVMMTLTKSRVAPKLCMVLRHLARFSRRPRAAARVGEFIRLLDGAGLAEVKVTEQAATYPNLRRIVPSL